MYIYRRYIIRLLVRRAYERPFTYTSSLVVGYHLPWNLNFLRNGREVLRARVTFQKFLRRISHALSPPSSPFLRLSLSLYRFLLSISRSPLRSVLSVRKGGSRETLAPYRNYRLAGINSRVYIEWRKTRREGGERAQEGWAREEMGSGSVLNLAFKFPDPPGRCLLFLFSSYSSSLFFIRQLPIPVSSATRRLALISTLAPPTLPRNGGRSFSLARETALYHAEKERRNTRDENIMWTEMDVTGERDRGEERERWRQKRRMSWSYTISEFWNR